MPKTKLLTVLAACAGLAAAAIPASARKPYEIPAPGPCVSPAGGEQVFARFRDRRSYFLAPDGGFENGAAGWTLNDATVVDGSEPFGLGGAVGSKSLSLPAASSATSPVVCISRDKPMFRFVAKRVSGSRKARLRVEVLYASGKGKASRVAGKLRGGAKWAPTKKLAIALGRALGPGRDATGEVSFRFTPRGRADWQIDGLYVDPRARR